MTNVVVTDDQGLIPVYVSGDDGDNILQTDEIWIYEVTSNPTEDVCNIGTVTAEDELGMQVSDNDTVCVDVQECGCTPRVSIDKKIFNGKTWVDNLETQEKAPIDVTFKIIVDNIGTCDLKNILITDTIECGIENPRDFVGEFQDYDISGYKILFMYNLEPFALKTSSDPIIITFNATVYINVTNHVRVDANSTYDETHVYAEDEADISFTEIINNAPYKPTTPNPVNEQENVSVAPKLSVYVEDPDGDSLTVYFYNASDDSLIYSLSGVTSGTRAEITWDNLSYNTTYSWYAVADDGQYTNKSDTFVFKTKKYTGEKPIVKITAPTKGLYLRNKHFPKLFANKIFIIGGINITALVSDNDSEITHVDFLIDSDIVNSTKSEPYSYYWNEKFIGFCTITVRAYDSQLNIGEDSIEVFVINLGLS